MRDPYAPKDKQKFAVSFDETTWPNTKRCGDGDTCKHACWKDWKDFEKEKAEKKPESGNWKEHHTDGNANAVTWNENGAGNKAHSGTWKEDFHGKEWIMIYKKIQTIKQRLVSQKENGETLASGVATEANMKEETKQTVLERRQTKAKSASRDLLLNHAAATQKTKMKKRGRQRRRARQRLIRSQTRQNKAVISSQVIGCRRRQLT